jgi:hypothetical protein
VSVGDAALARAIGNWNSSTGGASVYRVIAGFSIVGSVDVLKADTGWRVVGNVFTAPQGDGEEGTLEVHGNRVRIYGNEFHDCGAAASSKLCHAIYVSSGRSATPRRLPTPISAETASWSDST